MPMFEPSVAMITSQQPSSAALPAKQSPGGHADQRHEAAEAARMGEGRDVEAGHPGGVGVARPPAAALGEEDDREPQPLDQLEEAVLLAVVLVALGAGQHHVVVGHDRSAGAVVVEEVAVDAAEPGDQAVGRRALDEVLDASRRARCAATTSAPYSTKLPGSHRSSTFSPGRALAAFAPAGHGVGAGRVERERLAPVHLGEVVPDRVEVDGLGALGRGVGRPRRPR